MAVVVFLRRQVQNQIGTQQQSRIGLGTQNLARHNVHQIGETRSRLRELPQSPGFQGKATDAQAVNLNSGLLQGENTELDSGKGGGLEPPGPGPFSNHLTLQKILHSTMQYICSNSYLRFAVSVTIETYTP